MDDGREVGYVKPTERKLAIRRDSDYEIGRQGDLLETWLPGLGFSLQKPISIGLE